MENPFKKYFSSPDSDGKDKLREKPNKFKKFDYPDDDDDFDLEDLFSEFHGSSFNFQGFPPAVMKQFQEIFEAMQEFEDDPNNMQRKSLFEDKYNEFRQKTDQDLDGQQYAEQLDTLLKRISPDHAPKNSNPMLGTAPKKVKMLDEDKILDIIHGTFPEEIMPAKPRKRPAQKVPAAPHHFGGIPPFDLPPSTGRTWGRTVISIRKQDGSYETRKTEHLPDGQTTTTITKRGSDGTSSTQTITGDGGTKMIVKGVPAGGSHAERNLVMFDGYKIPCLW